MIRPNLAEIKRASNTKQIGPVTIIKRKQDNGTYLVALVKVDSGEIVFGTYYEFVNKEFIGKAAKRLLRNLDKFTGVVSRMAWKSRKR